jgi:hypothetical protein
MNKKNEDLDKEYENLIKQDMEMWAIVLSAQDYKVDDLLWEDIWIKYYEWDRIKIRFTDPKHEKFFQIKEKMGALKAGAWKKTTDPNLIAFRNAMEKNFPVNESDAYEIWMNDEYYKWTFKVKRLFDLIPPFIKKEVSIPLNICTLYSETRECYIAGNFRACIALSRSVLECCIKNRWDRKKDKEWTLGKALNNLLRIGNISHELYSIGDNINNKANDILHQGLSANEEEALYFIDATKDFIEEFYKK